MINGEKSADFDPFEFLTNAVWAYTAASITKSRPIYTDDFHEFHVRFNRSEIE